jgi:xanthine dehydrogenase YagR molybdenum-binding subunit
MSTYGKANASGGSTTVPSLAPAVKDASAQARAELVNRAAKVLECKPEEVVVRPGRFASPTGKKLDFKQVAALCPPDGLTFRGTWKDTLSSTTTHPVQFAEVEVDTETGKVNVLKVVAVQDCGLCLNELLTESQIEGAVIQSLSYGTLEERVVDPRLGLVLNANMEDYKIAGTTEIPEIVTIIDDKDDRPVIGIGEPPIIPTQSAIANAVYNACGVRITSLPITPDKVLMGLQTLEQEGRRS